MGDNIRALILALRIQIFFIFLLEAVYRRALEYLQSQTNVTVFCDLLYYETVPKLINIMKPTNILNPRPTQPKEN